MKILIVSPSINRTKGGIASVVNNQLHSNAQEYGFEMNHLITHVEDSGVEKIFHFLNSCVFILKSRDYDLVHIHTACYKSFLRKSILTLISRMKGLPVILHVHGSDFDKFYRESSNIVKYFIRRTFKTCKKVIVLSKYWQDFFHENIVSKEVEILYNGVDISYFKECITVTPPLAQFLFLGRLGQRKGVFDLLKAVEIVIRRKDCKNAVFYLAGDGDLEEVQRVIDSLNLSKNVFVLGWLNDEQKKEWFKKVSTIVLPSYSEGLPMALLEAMACGKVVISSRVGGIPELVEEGENGFLITPGDIEKIVQLLLHILYNPELVQQISANNIKKIEQTYNLQRLNLRLYEIYAESLSYEKSSRPVFK